MDIGISTACFYPTLTEEALDKVAKMNIHKAEVFFNAVAEYDIEYCKRLEEILAAGQIEVVSVHAFCIILEPYLFNEYERRRSDSFLILQKFLSAAQYLGAKYYTFHGNLARATTQSFDYAAYAAQLDRIADLSGEYGIRLAWENVSWCQSGAPQFIERTMEYAKSDNIGFTFDFKQAFRSQHQPEEYFKVMGDKIVNIHINDMDVENQCCLPGKGILDYPKYFSLLQDYHGDLILEVYSENYDNSIQILNSISYLEEYTNFFSRAM